MKTFMENLVLTNQLAVKFLGYMQEKVDDYSREIRELSVNNDLCEEWQAALHSFKIQRGMYKRIMNEFMKICDELDIEVS